MNLEIITPESKIFEGDVSSVRLPGKEGLFQVLNGHAPMISTLAAGEVKIGLSGSAKAIEALHDSIETDKTNDKTLRMQVSGGVVEIQKDKVILLAD